MVNIIKYIDTFPMTTDFSKGVLLQRYATKCLSYFVPPLSTIDRLMCNKCKNPCRKLRLNTPYITGLNAELEKHSQYITFSDIFTRSPALVKYMWIANGPQHATKNANDRNNENTALASFEWSCIIKLVKCFALLLLVDPIFERTKIVKPSRM